MRMYELHVPVEQYGFISEHLETNDPNEAVEAYQILKKALQSGDGLQNREWCKVMDSYVSTGKLEGGAEVWERMNDYQRSVIQELKRCFARTNKK